MSALYRRKKKGLLTTYKRRISMFIHGNIKSELNILTDFAHIEKTGNSDQARPETCKSYCFSLPDLIVNICTYTEVLDV